jgi:hypothetical protein
MKNRREHGANMEKIRLNPVHPFKGNYSFLGEHRDQHSKHRVQFIDGPACFHPLIAFAHSLAAKEARFSLITCPGIGFDLLPPWLSQKFLRGFARFPYDFQNILHFSGVESSLRPIEASLDPPLDP